MNIALSRSDADKTANARGFLGRYQAIRDTLGDHGARDAAADWLSRHGLPRRTEEAWRYTDLRRLWDADRADATAMPPAQAASMLAELIQAAGLDESWPRLVFVDGVLSAALSRRPDLVACDGLGRASEAAPDHPILALNTMLAADGASLRVADGVDAGRMLLITLGSGGGLHLRHRLVLEPGASLTLLEIAAGTGNYVNDGVIEIEVRERARLNHVRVQQDGPDAVSLSQVRVTVAGHGSYDGFNLALGASLARHEVRARLEGEYGIVHVNGAQLLSGTQIADLTSAIMHAAPRCSSRQTVKNVLAGKARGVFQGKIVVDRIAQKTDGYQMNQALLLSAEAEIDSKPELEIFADDVKCSHGATAGALDDEQLFYMRSRGVPEAAAREILVRAFLDDALGLVEDERVRDVLERAVARWWDSAR